MPDYIPSYYLKEPNSTKETYIDFTMPMPGLPKPIKRSIGKKVLPSLWVSEDNYVDAGKNKDLQAINKRIDEINQAVDDLKRDCKRDHRVMTKEDVEHVLDVILQKKGRGKKVMGESEYKGGRMEADFQNLIGRMRDGKILTPGNNPKRYEESTMKNYDKLMRALFGNKEEPFIGFYEATGIIPDYEIIDRPFYDQFIAWCHGMDYAKNSIGVFVKCWKKLLKLAQKEKWHSNTFFSDEEFVKPKEEATDIALDENQLNKLSLAEFKGKDEVARDWGLLDAYLGLRISDLQKISDDDFSNDIFQFVNIKTGEKVAIPIHPTAKRILKRWEGLPPEMPEHEFRILLKVVARRAGLRDRFLHKITKGGKVVKQWIEYWEMVSPHTFRRTFITNLLKKGVPHLKVMKMAGIKDMDTLKTYDKESVEENAENMKKHAFFQTEADLRRTFRKDLKTLIKSCLAAGVTKEQIQDIVNNELD